MIQHDLGAACLETGLLTEAVAALEQAVAVNSRFAKAHLRLGMAWEARGQPVPAIAAYRKAAAAQPSLVEAQFRAGNLLDTLGHTADAVAAFRRAASSASKSALGRIAAARVLLAENRDKDAERVLRQILALTPSNAMAREMLGTVLADMGRFEEARACYDRAIAEAPLLAGSFYDMVRCRPLNAADAVLVARIQASLDDPRLDAAQRVRLHLALGKAADDMGDPAAAMAQFDAADVLRRTIAPFDARQFGAQADRIIALFTPDVIARATANGADDATPLLILGLPRSGTTLLEQIVSSYGSVAGGGELPFWDERGRVAEALGPSGLEPPFLKQAASEYLQTLRGVDPTALRVTDKMPLNLVWAGLIHLAFPRATILHCRRTPLDTAVSIHQTYFNPRRPLPTGGQDLVDTIRAARRLAAHWRQVLPADRFIEVDYEALVTDPTPVIKRVVAACGLAWDEACLRPERNTRTVRTPSKWQARQPIHGGAVGRWRRYETWLGPLRALSEDR